MTLKAVAMNQRRAHPLIPATSHVTLRHEITLPVTTVRGTIRLATTSQGITRLETIRRVTLAHATATIPRVIHHETRPSFEDCLKRLFVASLAVDWTSSFAICCDLCVWVTAFSNNNLQNVPTKDWQSLSFLCGFPLIFHHANHEPFFASRLWLISAASD